MVARDRKVSATAVVAVIPDLGPGRAWAVDADRYAVVDDEAAVALTDLGVDGARVTVVGPLVPRALHDAARADKAATRAEFKLPADAKVVLVDTRGLALETLAQLTLQLSLASRPIYVLFDAATSTDAAAQVRRQVPTLGIKGKLFGDTPNASKLWRSADVVLARPTARAIHAALAIDAGFVALQPEGAHEEAEVRALVDRHLGAGVSQVLFAGSALEPLLARRTGKAPADGAGEVAELVGMVAAHHEEVLAETAAAAAERAAASAAAGEATDAAGDVEDLDDWSDLGGDAGEPAAAPPPPRRPDLSARRAKLEREVNESRAEAEKWEKRRADATRAGDRALAEQAAREADRKRARMHMALADLAKLADEPATASAAGAPPHRSAPRPPPPEDPLAAFKRKVGNVAPSAPRSVDDELAALKVRIEAEKKGRRP